MPFSHLIRWLTSETMPQIFLPLSWRLVLQPRLTLCQAKFASFHEPEHRVRLFRVFVCFNLCT